MKFEIKETPSSSKSIVEVNTRGNESFIHLLCEDVACSELSRRADLANEAMTKGIDPTLCEEGVGGTYFLYDMDRKVVGVFKPHDEEPYNFNNPKGYSPRRDSKSGFKEGILVGEAAVRECAAYVLDHEHFGGVPPTDLALCRHPVFHLNFFEDDIGERSGMIVYYKAQFVFQPPSKSQLKLGSFQEFVTHDGDCDEIPPVLYKKFPVEEVHKIACLDIRLMNTDRHGGNILYEEVPGPNGQSTYVLKPIDHGYTLPSTLDEATFEWLNWPQAKEPMSERTKKYIKSLDIKKDIEIMQKKFLKTFRAEHFHVFRIVNTVLQKAVDYNLTFFQIGSIIYREDINEPSALEKICSEAKKRTAISSTGMAKSHEDMVGLKKPDFMENFNSLLALHLQSV